MKTIPSAKRLDKKSMKTTRGGATSGTTVDPNVCVLPSPGAPVPIPYPNVADSPKKK